MCSLKFRVWSLEQNTYRYKFPYNSLGQFYVSESGKIFSDFGNTVAPEVEQKNFIVEQYTGLKDKNGKSIYAGDIVRVNDDYETYGIAAGNTYEVYFHNGGFRCKPKADYAVRRGDSGYLIEDGGDFEVIGNIHESNMEELCPRE